jgi:hypothetical protein
MHKPTHIPAILAAFVATSIASGSIGALIGLHSPHSTTLQLRQLEIIDAKGTPRIVLGIQDGQPILHLDTADRVPLIQLATHEHTLPPAKDTFVEPTLNLKDQDGRPTISLFGSTDHRGLLAFSSTTREGKLLLGNFGITDDGTDNTLWGMRVSGPNGTGRQLGVLALDGKDIGLQWPELPSPFHKETLQSPNPTQ